MIHHLLAFARVAGEAGRIDQARELLSELDAMTARYSDGMAEVHARISAVKQLVQADAAAQILDEPLTGREVEVLQLFQGSMSLQQIASEAASVVQYGQDAQADDLSQAGSKQPVRGRQDRPSAGVDLRTSPPDE